VNAVPTSATGAPPFNRAVPFQRYGQTTERNGTTPSPPNKPTPNPRTQDALGVVKPEAFLGSPAPQAALTATVLGTLWNDTEAARKDRPEVGKGEGGLEVSNAKNLQDYLRQQKANYSVVNKLVGAANLTPQEWQRLNRASGFIPTDEAFKGLPPTALNTLINDPKLAKAYLLYHLSTNPLQARQWNPIRNQDNGKTVGAYVGGPQGGFVLHNGQLIQQDDTLSAVSLKDGFQVVPVKQALIPEDAQFAKLRQALGLPKQPPETPTSGTDSCTRCEEGPQSTPPEAT
jgi:uncharacterized surface protein with fasciclin (FAS1) repeats